MKGLLHQHENHLLWIETTTFSELEEPIVFTKPRWTLLAIATVEDLPRIATLPILSSTPPQIKSLC